MNIMVPFYPKKHTSSIISSILWTIKVTYKYMIIKMGQNIWPNIFEVIFFKKIQKKLIIVILTNIINNLQSSKINLFLTFQTSQTTNLFLVLQTFQTTKSRISLNLIFSIEPALHSYLYMKQVYKMCLLIS